MPCLIFNVFDVALAYHSQYGDFIVTSSPHWVTDFHERNKVFNGCPTSKSLKLCLQIFIQSQYSTCSRLSNIYTLAMRGDFNRGEFDWREMGQFVVPHQHPVVSVHLYTRAPAAVTGRSQPEMIFYLLETICVSDEKCYTCLLIIF